VPRAVLPDFPPDLIRTNINRTTIANTNKAAFILLLLTMILIGFHNCAAPVLSPDGHTPEKHQ
jgi:hypothetical protein